ncbi:alpha-xenorhabdolysin family binary toxin subunit B [Pseudomonas phoenicis]|uniref:alpha-xenorhabdolysin family binary toxin subunit B n=1 Tax=unclassified Pseudomonas TaxID=196821 RepID=UPI0039A39DAD
MSTTSAVSPSPLDSVKIDAMASATNFYLKTWQQNDFEFSPRVADVMSRHTKLLERFRDKFISTAQRLEAKMSPDALGAIMEMSNEQDDADLIEQAREEVSGIADLLAQQVSFVAQEFKALASLPELDALDDIQRLRKSLEQKTSSTTAAEQVAAQLAAELESVDKAIATLKGSNVEIKSGGLVPAADQLTHLLGTAANAEPVIAGVQLALKTLEQVLGSAVSGIGFKSLYNQANQLRERAHQKAAEARELSTQSSTLKSQIDVLEKLPQLQQQLEQWKGAGKQLSDRLVQYQNALSAVVVQKISNVRELQPLCHELLSFERTLMTQMEG